jgi:hypothetical protein
MDFQFKKKRLPFGLDPFTLSVQLAPPLFKYLKRQHAEAFFKHGSVKIGTMYEYRDMEKYGGAIGDKLEGTKHRFDIVEENVWTEQNQPEWTKKIFGMEDGARVRIKDCSFTTETVSPDHNIYCVTSKFSIAAMKEFGYDSCFIIDNPVAFFAEISKGLPAGSRFAGAYQCSYTNGSSHENDKGVHEALVKYPEYAYQSEVRALWDSGPDPKPQYINCPKAAQYCRPLI